MNQRKPNRTQWYALGLTVLLAAACLVGSMGTAFARYRAEEKRNITFQAKPAVDNIYLGKLVTPEPDPEASTPAESLEPVFQADAATQWQTQENTAILDFAVANGQDQTQYAQADQQVRIRLVGTLGILDQGEVPAVKLLLPEGSLPDQELESILESAAVQNSETTQESESAGEDESASEEESTDESGSIDESESTGESEPTTEEEESFYLEIPASYAPILEGSSLHTTFGAGWVYTFQDAEGKELTWTLKGGSFGCIPLRMTVDAAVPISGSLLQLQVIVGK